MMKDQCDRIVRILLWSWITKKSREEQSISLTIIQMEHKNQLIMKMFHREAEVFTVNHPTDLHLRKDK